MARRLEELILAAENPIGKKQRRIFFKKKRSGVLLTREQVAAIKLGRKLLRAEMKAKGLKDKEDFELTASSMGLYFDKHRFALLFPICCGGRGALALLGGLLLLLGALFLYSLVTQLQGHFTINMTDDMFREGFVLSDTVGFENPTTHLFAQPAENVPCVSIIHIPDNIDQIDGQHNADYFAYTFYVRNEGESTVGYDWQLNLNSESLNLSSACWVMVFEDGKMKFYAEPNTETGEAEALPAFDDNTRGYIDIPTSQYLKRPGEQYQLIAHGTNFDYFRAIPYTFESEDVVTRGQVLDVDPMEVHKYTIVIWLEGDDPDCTNDLIGGHVGMDMQFKLITEDSYDGGLSWSQSVGENP